MIVKISSDAEVDLLEGHRFYESQCPGLGDSFREGIMTDVDSLRTFAGIHQIVHERHRMLCKRFPFAVYYDFERDKRLATVIAVLDCRRNPSWIRGRLEGP